MALEATLMEVSCSPSPGLVDRFNSGAHTDMNFFTFIKSSSSIAGTFLHCAAAGFNHEEDPEHLLPVLRLLGKKGEADMLKATSGVNTHRGLLFVLGILCASAAYCTKQFGFVNVQNILGVAARICKDITTRELVPLKQKQTLQGMSAGERLFVIHDIKGIRGEIEEGLPSIRLQGLPRFREALDEGLSINDALLHTLVALMTVVQDTTVINRNGLSALAFMKDQAQEILDNGGMLHPNGKKSLEKLDRLFIEKRISPGGVADLLAATYFLHALTDEVVDFSSQSLIKLN